MTELPRPRPIVIPRCEAVTPIHTSNLTPQSILVIAAPFVACLVIITTAAGYQFRLIDHVDFMPPHSAFGVLGWGCAVMAVVLSPLVLAGRAVGVARIAASIGTLGLLACAALAVWLWTFAIATA